MKNFSRLLLALIVVTAIGACKSGSNGQLTGVLNRPAWKGINPYGMVYVPSGTLHIGPSDQDVNHTMIQRPRSISIQGFYMDDTEITNNEYRQFVNWVRDSMAHSWMDHYVETDDGSYIDWDQDVDYTSEELEDMYFSENERFAGKKEFNNQKLIYEYQWYDWKRAAHDHYQSNRTKFIKKNKIGVYPDTLVWVRDFTYSYNEPMTRNYFWHPAFDDYPVVGVDWRRATAFCYWRTKFWDAYRTGKGEVNTEDFRLPTEHEWEYASRGGHDLAPFPWGGYYVRNAKGCILANFKPGRGNYPEDGGLYTVKADAYFPNDYGLYNMAGNVAEWTSSAFYENGYAFQHDLNPDIRMDAEDDDPQSWKRKVIRGGSWKDIAFYIQTGSRHWEYQDTTKSYIGFRCALTFLGRSINDFQ
ncbi:MAG: SUMF1/EgtB/PvdO family nonheme iron enzyme [Bacteroidota bacterium]